MHKRSITIGIALGALAVSLAAAQPRPPSKAVRLTHLRNALALTTEQIGPVERILASTDKKVEDLRDKGITDPRSLMDTMKKIFDEEDVKIERILTSVQKTKFNGMNKDREKHRPGAQGDGPPRKDHDGARQGQNRTRETRPSGTVGGLMETWIMVGTRLELVAEWPTRTNLNLGAPCFFPTLRVR